MWFLAAVFLGPLYRRLLLAPFGGDERLLRIAASRLRSRPPTDLYSDGGRESTAPVALALAFRPAVGPAAEEIRSVAAALPPGGSLLAVDHNAPRRLAARLAATLYVGLGWPVVRSSPSIRLRRPLARDLQALGLEVVALRLLAGELFQAVLARKPPAR